MRRTVVGVSVFGLAVGAVIGFSGCGGGGTLQSSGSAFTTTVLVANAAFPSALKFAPDGRLFYTELKTGKVRVVANGQLLPTPFATLPADSNPNAEVGVLGLAFDPQFSQNGFVYVCYTDATGPVNKVVRFTDSNSVGGSETTVVDNLTTSTDHNGGRIVFGSDGKLYVTIGDNENPANSQDQNVLPGKILRYNPDGSIPSDNPVSGNPFWCLGMRNTFGMGINPTSGALYVSENGPACDDEVNKIVKGGNYGWRPGQPCGDTNPNFIRPLIRLNPTVGLTGATFYDGSAYPQFDGSFFATSINDGDLRRFVVNDSGAGSITSSQVVLRGIDGGLLDVTQGPDGFLYLAGTTSILKVIRIMLG